MRLRTVLNGVRVDDRRVVQGHGCLEAQEPGEASHPADIRGGSCSSLGEVVAPLIALAIPAGEPQGRA